MGIAEAGALTKQDKGVLNLTNSACVNVVHGVEEVKITYLEELLRQKDLTILNQSIAINSLQEQLVYLKREMKLQEETHVDCAVAEGESNQRVLSSANSSKSKNKNKSKSTLNNASIIPAPVVSHAIHLAQPQKIYRDINLFEQGYTGCSR